MAKKPIGVEKYELHPLTPERWDDFEALFGPNGACAGCWCMWFLMTHKEFSTSGKEGHKNALRTLVHSGFEPGIIAYADGIPAGWVAIAPRERYVRLETSKILAPVDGQPVWSLPCFFIHKKYRRIGLMEKLIHETVQRAKNNGAKIIEAYPFDGQEKMTAVSIFTGVNSVFQRLGFKEVARRSETRPIMRYSVKSSN